MGILNIYFLVGLGVAGRIFDWIGRRYIIVLVGVFFFCGVFFMGFVINYFFIMVGRFVVGIGVGYVMMIVSVYTVEVVFVIFRGFFSFFFEV